MPAKKKSITVVLSEPKAKKHVVRYDAQDDDAILANAYLTKAGLEQLGNPEKVKITVEAA